MHSTDKVVAEFDFLDEDVLWALFQENVPKGQIRDDAKKMLENMGGSFSYGVWLLLSNALECLRPYNGRHYTDEFIADVLFRMNEDGDVLNSSDTLVKVNERWTDVDVDNPGFSVVDYDRTEGHDAEEIDYSKRQQLVMDKLELFIQHIAEYLELDTYELYTEKIIFVLLEDGIITLSIRDKK